MSTKTTARQMGLRGIRAMRKKTTVKQRRAWAKKGALATKRRWKKLENEARRNAKILWGTKI